LYQPFASGPRAVAALATGDVASYFRPSEADCVFPALSLQIPPTLAVALSGPL
jgi:hypothetical protein